MCFGCTVMSYSKRSEFGSRDQKTTPSAGKSTRAVLEPYRSLKCVLTVIFVGVDISEVLGYLFITFLFFGEVQKSYIKDKCLI